MTHVLVHAARAHDVTRVVLALERGGLHPRIGDAETMAAPWAGTGGLAGVPVFVPETERVAAQELLAGLDTGTQGRARARGRGRWPGAAAGAASVSAGVALGLGAWPWALVLAAASVVLVATRARGAASPPD